LIQLVMVLICAAVRHVRMLGHSSGMRALVQPLTDAMTACAITLVPGLLGTISIRLVHGIYDPAKSGEQPLGQNARAAQDGGNG